MHAEFSSENLKGRDRLEDIGVVRNGAIPPLFHTPS